MSDSAVPNSAQKSAVLVADDAARAPGKKLSAWKQWWRRPQNIWLRRALFQIHLWTGIAVGLYMIVISLTGSLVVYRKEFSRHYMRPVITLPITGPRFTDAQMTAAAERDYPGYSVAQVVPGSFEMQPTQINLVRGGAHLARLYNPYTGADLGDPLSAPIRAMDWLADLHDNLLGGPTGRYVNGVGGMCTCVLALTGIVIWWPGVKNWRRALAVDFKARFARLNWDVHSALGFWFFLFVLLWGLSGVYLSFPKPFYALFNVIDPNDNFTDNAFEWFEFLHYGRFGHFVEAIYVVIGLVPAILFLSGAIMWWNRVLRKGPRIPQ